MFASPLPIFFILMNNPIPTSQVARVLHPVTPKPRQLRVHMSYLNWKTRSMVLA
jgi:hypothetical protein